MREPKTFKRPRLYWAPLPDNSDNAQLIIIYPDGRAPERDGLGCCYNFLFRSTAPEIFPKSYDKFEYAPCWYTYGMTPAQQVKVMYEYAKANKFCRFFIGEL